MLADVSQKPLQVLRQRGLPPEHMIKKPLQLRSRHWYLNTDGVDVVDAEVFPRRPFLDDGKPYMPHARRRRQQFDPVDSAGVRTALPGNQRLEIPIVNRIDPV